MEALLYNSLIVIIPIVLSYAIGFSMRLFWEVKLFLGFIILFVLFGIFMHSVVIGAEIALTPNMTWFITFSSFIIWLGYITAPKIADMVDAKAEDLFTSDAFDETYRKYAQTQKQRHESYHWHDPQDYHKWRQESYRQSENQQGEQTQDSNYQNSSYQETAYNSLSQKDKMLTALELSTKTVSKGKIKTAYRKLARQYHPDILAGQQATEQELDNAMTKMQEINAAYDWLQENGYA